MIVFYYKFEWYDLKDDYEKYHTNIGKTDFVDFQSHTFNILHRKCTIVFFQISNYNQTIQPCTISPQCADCA